MSSIGASTHFTPEEYLILERKAEYKSEFLFGKIVAMSGASQAHNFITLDIATELNIQLRGRNCDVYSNDMRLRIRQSDLYFYPDVVVGCDEPIFEDDFLDSILNPVIIIEVLSPSTEEYDRGEKFEYYKQLPSLKEYLLVAQNKVDVEHHVLQEKQWQTKKLIGLHESVILASIGCKLSLNEIYRRVTFD